MANEQENQENEPLNLNEDELKEEFEFLSNTQEENEMNSETPEQTGEFHTEEENQELNITKKEKYVFDADHINDLRLNLKLSILNQSGLSPEQKAKLLSDADSNETMIYDKETMKLIALEESIKLDDGPNDQNVTKAEANETKKVEKTTPELFVQIAYVKSENLKMPKLDSAKFGAKVSICKDSKNMAQILIGPFENESKQKKSLAEIKKIKQFNDAFTTKLTQADYEKKCSF